MMLDEGKCKYNILIIDDSKPLRETVADILSSIGYTTHQAGSAIEGMALYETHLIDLVIMDMNMPDQNGAEMYRELLMIDPEVNIVIYSADPFTAVSKRFAPLAIPYFLQKPVSLRDLYETIELALKGPELLSHSQFWQRKAILTS